MIGILTIYKFDDWNIGPLSVWPPRGPDLAAVVLEHTAQAVRRTALGSTLALLAPSTPTGSAARGEDRPSSHHRRDHPEPAAPVLSEAVRHRPDDSGLRLHPVRVLPAAFGRRDRFAGTSDPKKADLVARVRVRGPDAVTDPEATVLLVEAAIEGVDQPSRPV